MKETIQIIHSPGKKKKIFETRYKEHLHYFRNNNNTNSKFAQQLL
jgi:hypothetical protein